MSSNITENLIVKDGLNSKKEYRNVNLDPKIAYKSNLKIGDIIEIRNTKNNRITVGRLIESELTDVGTNYIYLNWFLRRNLLVSVGDSVAIRKIVPKNANLIEFIGFDRPIKIKNFQKIKLKLPSMIFSIGDILSFDFRGNLVTLAVKNYEPEAAAVAIRDSTKFVFNG